MHLTHCFIFYINQFQNITYQIKVNMTENMINSKRHRNFIVRKCMHGLVKTNHSVCTLPH